MSGLVDALQNNSLFYTVFIFAVFMVGIYFLVFIFRTYVNKNVLKRYARKDKLLEKSESVFIIVIFLIGLDVALQRMVYEDDVIFTILRSLLVIFFTFLIIEVSTLLLDVWGKHMTKRKGHEFHEEVMPLTHNAVKILLFLIAILVILEFWGVRVWTLLASVGVASVILGFGLKDSLENVFSGIALILDKTFKAGDVIQIEGEAMGEVLMINLRSTRIKTYDEKMVSIPNGVLANSRITNYSQPTNLLRVMVEFGVSYGSDPSQVNKVVLGGMKSLHKVLDRPRPEVKFLGMNDFSLDFRLEIFTRFHSVKSLEKLKDQVTRAIHASLLESGIKIPYPTRVHINVPYEGKPKKQPEFVKGKV